MAEQVTLAALREAQARIAGTAYHTPLIRSHLDAGLYFKPESLQPIGSFKLRGAYNRLAAMRDEERARGVVAFSSGNHAQGVAYAAQRLGMRAVIVMPRSAPRIKIENTRSYGAEIVLYDVATESREAIAQALQAQHGYILVPPFNDPYIIAGQGTIGLEIFADLPDVDLVITPVGGGGLISGVAAALKQLKPAVRVVGVEPEVAADARASLQRGEIVAITAADAQRTLADGVRTLALGDLTFAHVQAYVDDIVTVSETALKHAFRRLVLQHKLTVEPTAALPLAAYLSRRHALPAAAVTVLVLSGGSIDPAQLAALVTEDDTIVDEVPRQD